MARKGGNPELVKHQFKKGDSKAKECQKKSIQAAAENRKKKANMQEVAKALLDAKLSPAAKKKIKELYPDLDDSVFTTRLRLMLQMLDIVYKSENDNAKIQGFKEFMAYTDETPDIFSQKQEEQAKQQALEDDPFSKSIKELLQ